MQTALSLFIIMTINAKEGQKQPSQLVSNVYFCKPW